MLYALREAAYSAAAPLRTAAEIASDFWRSPFNLAGQSDVGRRLYASSAVIADLTRCYFKPVWGIDHVVVWRKSVPSPGLSPG